MGITTARSIRFILIRPNLTELQRYGGLIETNSNPGKKGGRPAKVYYLNEGQALLVCMFSRTELAADARQQVIETQLPLPYVIAIFCQLPDAIGHPASSRRAIGDYPCHKQNPAFS